MTRNWKQQGERSTPFMLRLLVRAALLFGRPLIRLVLWPVALYFWLTHPSARAASRRFLTRALGRVPRPLEILRHFHTFASVSVDRVYLLSGRDSVLEFATQFGPGLPERMTSGRGCLLVVAHFGSFESLRVPAVRRRSVVVRIVLDRAAGRMALALFEELDAGLAAGIIDAARPGSDVMLDIKQALDAGHIVGIMGDRARDEERAVEATFLGASARFPAGPWIIAAALGVPVVLGFGILRGTRSYQCRFELFSEKLDLPRATREVALQAIVQRYALRLEAAARDAPYNWFNFYEFWRDDGSHDRARD